jgi:hypothetical protein
MSPISPHEPHEFREFRDTAKAFYRGFTIYL